MGSLILIEWKRPTNLDHLSADEIVSEYLPQPAETVEDGSSDEDDVLHEPISPP